MPRQHGGMKEELISCVRVHSNFVFLGQAAAFCDVWLNVIDCPSLNPLVKLLPPGENLRHSASVTECTNDFTGNDTLNSPGAEHQEEWRRTNEPWGLTSQELIGSGACSVSFTYPSMSSGRSASSNQVTLYL